MARFQVKTHLGSHFIAYNLFDNYNDPPRSIASSAIKGDAEFICAKLNITFEPPSARWRAIQAWMIGDFRVMLEHDNGGPLTADPTLALLLDDLCNFMNFSTDEKMIALGTDLLTYLKFLSDTPTDYIQIINSTVEAQDLAEIYGA